MKRIAIASVFTLFLCTSFAQVFSFDKDLEGKPPTGFSHALTGKGSPGNWVVQQDETARSQTHVLAQTDADATSYRFPLCVCDKVAAADVDLSVKFKAVNGQKDQAAGLVWRFADTNNYYVVRANALEDNVVLYKVESGKRMDLKPKGADVKAYGRNTKVSSGEWHTLRVVASGKLFVVHLDGMKLFEVEDETFKEPGKVGLWTKADSVVLFDDFTVQSPR
jgi:hypothetical protein